MPKPSRSNLFAAPEDAEAAFYEALEKGDTEAMMTVWSEDEDTVCVHPTGVQLIGIEQIRDSWRSIFHSARLRVASVPVANWQGMLLAIHHLVENVFIDDDQNPHGPLFVTHVYSRGAHGWRLVSRHASAAGEAHAGDEDDPHDEPRPRILH